MLEVLRVIVFVAGVAIVLSTISSAIRSFVLPRATSVRLTQRVFLSVRLVMRIILKGTTKYEQRDRVMAFYAPVSLLLLPAVWLGLVIIGYTGIYWAVGINSWTQAFTLSGSSVLTLGFASVSDIPTTLLAFSEAIIGLLLIALLIAYLPTMYSEFNRRELAVTLLEVRAGLPSSAVEMILRYHRIAGLHRLTPAWEAWETWFSEIEESHTSFLPLVFFRSPQPGRAWVVAAGAVLDAASLYSSTLDLPRDYQAELCIRSGFLSLQKIARTFRFPFNTTHQKGDPIKMTRQQFDEAYDLFAAEGVPVKPDREQCWQDFAGWRVNYENVLYILSGLTMAPGAPWLPDQYYNFLGRPFRNRGGKNGPSDR